MARDLSKLSRDEKLRLLELIEEKKRRLREAQAVYKANPGQLPVHRSQATLRCVFSGNGAGKTALAVNEALWMCQGFNPVTGIFSRVPARVIVLLDHPEKVSDVWLPELSKWMNLKEEQMHKRGKPYVSRISFPNGSELLFMFHDQNALIFESIELDGVIADEPPPRHIYIALRRGGRKKGTKPRYLMIGTPISGSWMRREILDPWSKGELTDTDCFTFGTEVNRQNLADGYIESFSAILSEKERRIRLHGEFYDLEGLALAHLFKQEVHIIEPFEWDNQSPVVIAIDPHTAKPHHAMMLGADREGYLYYIKEIRAKAVARDFAKMLKPWMAGYRVVDIVSDCLGSSEYTSGEGYKSFIQVLNDEGVRCRATTWDDKSDEDFISRIQDVLLIPDTPNNFGDCVPKLRIFRGNMGIAGDIENVQWVKHRNLDEYKPKLDITNKDYLSCLKYGLATSLTYNKQKAAVYRRQAGAETYGVQNTRGPGSTPAAFRRKLDIALQKRNGTEGRGKRFGNVRHEGRNRESRSRNRRPSGRFDDD